MIMFLRALHSKLMNQVDIETCVNSCRRGNWAFLDAESIIRVLKGFSG